MAWYAYNKACALMFVPSSAGSSCNYSSGVNSPCEKPECQTDPMSTECMIAVVGYCASESGKMDPECDELRACSYMAWYAYNKADPHTHVCA